MSIAITYFPKRLSQRAFVHDASTRIYISHAFFLLLSCMLTLILAYALTLIKLPLHLNSWLLACLSSLMLRVHLDMQEAFEISFYY